MRENARRILVSAGEASGDLYASLVVEELRRIYPDAEFFGCTGPRLRAAGVRTVVDAASLAVVGLVEVLAHIPRIYGEYRKLLAAAAAERPDLAILTDSPDFHLRVARQPAPPGHSRGLPGRAPGLGVAQRTPSRQCAAPCAACSASFPLKRSFFAVPGVKTTYIGHPLAGLVRPPRPRDEFFRKHRLAPDRPLVAVLPGSRRGEAARHLPALLDAVDRIYREQAVNVVLPASATTGADFFPGTHRAHRRFR